MRCYTSGRTVKQEHGDIDGEENIGLLCDTVHARWRLACGTGVGREMRRGKNKISNDQNSSQHRMEMAIPVFFFTVYVQDGRVQCLAMMMMLTALGKYTIKW